MIAGHGLRARSAVLSRTLLPRSSCQERADRVVLQAAGRVFLHRRRGHELLEGGQLELAFASVAGCRSRMTAHLRRSGTRPRSPARRSAAGYGCGIVIRYEPASSGRDRNCSTAASRLLARSDTWLLDRLLMPSVSASFSTRRAGHAQQVRRGDHADQRLLRAAAALQHPVREVAALPQPGIASSIVPARVSQRRSR